MKMISPDRPYIDYWQDYGVGIKSHFAIRVWADRCTAITNVGSENPRKKPVLVAGPSVQSIMSSP